MSSEAAPIEVAPSCPAPLVDTERVLLGHGSGGKMTADLVARYFLPAFRNPYLDRLDDQAVLDVGGARLAFTTDSYVVSPLFFPGGDIGALAVNGTVNDIAMAGARPLYLSAGFILEEGFPLTDLRRIVASMSAAAQAAGVLLVTGDTKVVDRGKADGCFINTAGLGIGPARRGDLGERRAAGRSRGPERAHRRARHDDHGDACGARARVADRQRHRAASRAGARHARHGG